MKLHPCHLSTILHQKVPFLPPFSWACIHQRKQLPKRCQSVQPEWYMQEIPFGLHQPLHQQGVCLWDLQQTQMPQSPSALLWQGNQHQRRFFLKNVVGVFPGFSVSQSRNWVGGTKTHLIYMNTVLLLWLGQRRWFQHGVVREHEVLCCTISCCYVWIPKVSWVLTIPAVQRSRNRGSLWLLIDGGARSRAIPIQWNPNIMDILCFCSFCTDKFIIIKETLA